MFVVALFCHMSAARTGSVLPNAPEIPPGRVAPAVSDPLSVARRYHRNGDPTSTVATLSPWLESKSAPWGRTRVSGYLLMGMAQSELGNWNLASQYFTRVRLNKGPLAPWGAWYEALMDYNRGRHAVAARECEAYRKQWPDGAHADECLILVGDSYGAIGRRRQSLEAYQAYLEKNPESPRAETVRLGIALATAQTSPRSGISKLHDLVLSHSYASTASTAQSRLDELQALGHETTLPDNANAKMRLAASHRRSGKLEEAWALFEELTVLAEDDPAVARWVEANDDRFAWLTRRYDFFLKSLLEQYEAKPQAELAWRIFNAHRRAGQWPEAATWAEQAEEAHPTHYRWRGAKADIARAMMFAGRHNEASKRWAELADKRWSMRHEGAFYAGFSALMADDLEAAQTHLSKVAEPSSEYKASALYWRSRAHERQGETSAAQEDAQLAMAEDTSGWYTLMLAPPTVSQDLAWGARDGTWRGPTQPEVDGTPLLRGNPTLAQPAMGQTHGVRIQPRQQVDWQALAWPLTSHQTNQVEAAAPALVGLQTTIPSGITACTYYDPHQAQKAFKRFASQNADLWPQLAAAQDLVAAGMDAEAGAIVSEAYDEWRSGRISSGPRGQRLSQVTLNNAQWREIFLYARDYHHAARFCRGLDRSATSEQERQDALRLAYPIVAGRSVWSYSQAFSVDPLLIMAIMRQESTYKPTALSTASAVGLIQVMPGTGAKVAAMLGDTTYSPGSLEDPDTNLRYGIFYLSKVMERFDGVFPLAVASYNGGPHNVSRWLKGFDQEVPLDVFVEHIPWEETRTYVKKVTGHYRQYAQLYAVEGADVVVPHKRRGDDAAVVDF